MEYILNESYYKTTNGFRINNIKLDLELPIINDIKPFNDNTINQKIVDGNLTNRIGLTFDKYLDININLNNEEKILTYEFDKDNASMITNINITSIDKNNHLYLIFKSLDDSINFNYVNINNVLNNSNLNVTVINLLNNNSYSFIAYDNKITGKSILTNNHIDIGGNIKVNNYYSELLGEESNNILNTLYVGKNDNKLDYNYHIKNIASRTNSIMNTEGILSDNSYKQHKGIIDFIEGSKKSKGEELENCVLLSDKAISRSCPMLMCHEEDVDGSHGVSTGKLDRNKLFYLMSRGFDEKESKKIIIMANFNKIINNISNEAIKNQLIEIINQVI